MTLMTHCVPKRSRAAFHLFPTLLALMALSGCDKIKEVAGDVKSKVNETLEERFEEPTLDPEVNPLMRLVDQNDEGVIFRKDLDFPSELKVETSFKQKISGRVFIESELGREVKEVNGKETITAMFERKGSTVIYRIDGSSFELPKPDEEGAQPIEIQNPFRQAPPPAEPITFVRRGDDWKGISGGDFKLMAVSQQLSPVFGDLLIENAVLPRRLWFSPKRVKIGDEIELSGASLSMAVAGKAEGRLKLRLEGIDEVEDHPCGRFTVSGEFTRQNFPNQEGRLVDQEVSVESGELWLSLLYPIILKEKLQTIQTFEPSAGGGSIGKAQGDIDTLVIREWKADIPIPDPEPADVQNEDADRDKASGGDSVSES